MIRRVTEQHKLVSVNINKDVPTQEEIPCYINANLHTWGKEN